MSRLDNGSNPGKHNIWSVHDQLHHRSLVYKGLLFVLGFIEETFNICVRVTFSLTEISFKQNDYINFIAVNCGNISVANAEISFSRPRASGGGYSVGTVASFTCKYGYSLSGTDSRTCQASGFWTQFNPACNQSNENNTFL